MNSILLIGQSNMAGRGILDEANPPISDERIRTLINGRFQMMWEPLSHDRDFAGASLAPSFAQEYLNYTTDCIGLIPAAEGGSALDEWMEGMPLFDNAINLAELAMRQSSLAAVLWHQGEQDCGAPERDTYVSRFLKMKNAMKKSLGIPNLKFYVGGLGDYLRLNELEILRSGYTVINDALKKLSAENNDIEYIDASGLTDGGDRLHFDTRSLRELGRRYFAAFLADHPEMKRITETAQA